MTTIHPTDPHFICKMPSGMLCLSEMQFLRGYCILEAEPRVASINDLTPKAREVFLLDMTHVGDALLSITQADRINYAIMGNSQPFLHAHIIPRYTDEPAEYKHGLPWSYPDDHVSSMGFDPIHHNDLIRQIKDFISSDCFIV